MGFSRLETIVVIQSYKDYEYDKKGHFPKPHSHDLADKQA